MKLTEPAVWEFVQFRLSRGIEWGTTEEKWQAVSKVGVNEIKLGWESIVYCRHVLDCKPWELPEEKQDLLLEPPLVFKKVWLFAFWVDQNLWLFEWFMTCSISRALNLSGLKRTGWQVQSSWWGSGSGKVISRWSFHLGTAGCSCLIFMPI